MRGARSAVVALAAVAALAACGQAPRGVDGDLINGWPAFPKATTPLPKVGVCYPTDFNETWYGDFSTANDCAKDSHQTETVYVGAFTGADVDRSAPPLAGTAARRAAYDQCQRAGTDYLGGPWQGAKVDLGLVLPDDKAWTGGARWYRCDLIQYKDSDYQTVQTTGSAKDGLLGSRPLAVTCLIFTDDGKKSVTGTEDVDCAKPHNAEFVGLFTAPDKPWQADKEAQRKLAGDGCSAVVAHFLGYPGNIPYSNYLATSWSGLVQEQWSLGDRTVRCFALAFNGTSANNQRIVGSVKGLKGGAPHRA